MMTARAFVEFPHLSPVSDTIFDEIRAREYSRLDGDNQAYLDYTGCALYADSQITRHAERLRRTILGNPHSENGPSLVSTAIIREAKSKLLRFLDAPASEYVVCFTANTSAAIKLVAESYPFGPERHLILSSDNHNSMNGMREFARARNALVGYIALDDDLCLVSPRSVLQKAPPGSMFGFPAQSNFSGVKHPLSLIEFARQRGIMVLLDAAAFLPTNRLSLKRHPADFVVFSLYKIAGFPTGVGALVARRESLAKLKRPWFAGGTVQYASVQHRTHLLASENGEGFEDGTPAFIDIAAVADAIETIDRIGIEQINAHAMRHAREFIRALESLTHRNGRPLTRIYGPRITEDRGATVSFNVLDAAGFVIPFAQVVECARNEGVSLRGGCFCNPGASEAAFHFPAVTTARCFASLPDGEFTIDRFSRCLGKEIPVGAVRASTGIATNSRDIARAIEVIRSFA